MRLTLSARVALIVLITLFALGIGGCRRAGQWLVKNDMPARADALVILMGNFTERVTHAIDLYNAGIADRIIIVQESMGSYHELTKRGVTIITGSSQAVNAAVTLGVPADSITLLPGDARSTLTEAMIVKKFLENNPVTDSIILVTSPPHTRRAAMIFRKTLDSLPEPVKVSCSPSPYSEYNPGKWWKNKEDIQLVTGEYVKILSFLLIESKKTGSD